MEAMLARLPVVATDISGTNELVVHGQTGYLVPVGDTLSMARFIRQLLRDAALRQRMGRAGRERVLAHFTVERMVQEHVQTYLELAEQKGLLAAAGYK
jgi:glycosyltransferase involved in cell wall biosynthesis